MVINVLYFSNRELKILRLLVIKQDGISLNELVHTLGVSKRTVYRELSNLEDTLRHSNVQLEKKDKLYRLSGSPQALAELNRYLKSPITIEWDDPLKRQVAIMATIALKTDNQFTQTDLSHVFDVSLATIQQDIIQLNQKNSKYKLSIQRSEESKLSLTGNEVYLRLYLSQLITNEINEFDFYRVVEGAEETGVETESQYLLTIIDATILKMVYDSIKKEQPEMLHTIADDILKNFVILITISLMRLNEGKTVDTTQSIDYNQLLPYIQHVLSFVKTFDETYKTKINTTEVSFWAMQLRGINVQQSHSIFQSSYDMELAYKIRYLVKLVSNEFQFNFNRDQELYNDLINHIGAALKRLDINLPEIENEVITQLRQQYPKLYLIVEEKLIEVFSPAIFSEQEIGYVVTHFASSFEKFGYDSNLNVLVICSSGIGTSKILKSRLERSIKEINHIDVVRAVDLSNIDINDYKMVFSTITLPGFESDYTLINPILDDAEIETIKQLLKAYSSKAETHLPQIAATQKEKTSFRTIKQFVDLADDIIANFTIVFLDDQFQSLQEYVAEIFKPNEKLINKINKRLDMAPLAIPNTGILLLHTTDNSFSKPFLAIHHLKYPIETMGMDQKPTDVHRLIVMFGPEAMDELTTHYLGTISSSIIENEDYTQIYLNGTEADIKQLLEALSVDVLQSILT
ncbi:BglG family transcription antiterminator [Fundicoccus culcitae]|uniref:PRD domain-containing protein n=1 Tax=Fundicoccus culcitae TaxID=2969821 RepID=A0ABY5P8D1_9LACT|nr:PRD domain-containing protein [Fundicoccus culcitae]UUX35002.1 PRD domain-containing protein [Fundicoccus culcitae]